MVFTALYNISWYTWNLQDFGYHWELLLLQHTEVKACKHVFCKSLKNIILLNILDKKYILF